MRTMHLESLSNGLGAQSMLLFLMACRREIPATVSITADTGWEDDRTWNNGRVSKSLDYFNEVVVPFGIAHSIECKFVRSVDFEKKEMESLLDRVRNSAIAGKVPDIPMFGSKGGRARQICTDKWKCRACRQEARRMGAKTNCNAQGIHSGEADRRVKGIYLRNEGKWSIYQTAVDGYKIVNGVRTKYQKPIRWLTHYYPLVDLGINRQSCQEKVVKEGFPYLLSSECDGCPHKDLTRWERTSPAKLQELSNLEAMFNGEFFFTSKRIPLIEAIAVMQKEREANPERYKVEADFGCQNAICGV